MRIFLILVLHLLFFWAPVDGQCPDGSCSVPAVKVANDCPTYKWYPSPNNDRWVLYRDGVLCGQFYKPNHAYYPITNGVLGEESKPPIDVPEEGTAASAPVEQWQTHGIDKTKFKFKDGEHITMGGQRLNRDHLEAAFDGTLTDDSQKGYMVIIAKDEAKRKQVFADWQKLPVGFTSRYNVWMASPDHFSMQDRFAGKPRFFTEGDPSVILQDSTGIVLFRRPQANQRYSAADMQELLKADPSYKPELDPGAPAKSHGLVADLKEMVEYLAHLPLSVLVSVAFCVGTLIFVLVRTRK